MKKRVSLLLVIAMLLSMVPVIASAAEPTTLISVTDEAVTADGYVYEYTLETSGTLHVSVGTCSPSWQYNIVSSTNDYDSGNRGKYSAGAECDYALAAGDYVFTMYAYSAALGNTTGTVSFTLTFTPDGAEEPTPDASVEATEPANAGTLVSVTDEAVTADGYVYEYTLATSGTLHVSVGTCSPSWQYNIVGSNGYESGNRGKYSAGPECDYALEAGNYTFTMHAYSGATGNTTGTVSFTLTFTPDEATTPEETEAQKDAYAVSTTTLSVGSNTVSMIATAEATIFKFAPTEAGTYTITGPEGSKVGIWGYSTNLTDPNSTSNSCELNLANVGPTVRVGVTGAEGEIVLTVAKYEEPETEPTEPETEPTEPETEPTEPETEPTTPVIPDEDVPAGTYYSITVDGTTTYYTSFSTATMVSNLKKITGTGYVKLYQDLALGSNSCLDIYNGTITFDLNGCSVTNSYSGIGTLYVDGATVTIVDTSADADGSISNSHTRGHGLMVNSGTVTLQSGSVLSEYWGVSVYEPDAVFNMEGGYAYGKTYAVNVLNYSSANISGGTLEAKGLSTLVAGANATVYISGGYFNGGVPSGSGLNGRVSGGYYTATVNASRLVEGCEVVTNNDTVYKYKVVNPNVTEPSEPETEPTEPAKDPYAVSTTTLAVGNNTVSMIETAEATLFKFAPTEAGTYTITGPEGSKVGIWGYSSNLTNPNSTSNVVEWNCTNVGPTARIGVLDAEGEIVLSVEFTPIETEPTEPETEPTEPETEPTEPSTEATEPSEPAESGTLLSLTNESVPVTGYVFEYTAATAGTLNVTVGTCNPGWRYKVYFPDGTESIYRTKWSATETCDYEGEAGNWKIVFYAYSSTQADNVAGTVSFTVTFTPDEGGSGEVEKAEYEVSETELALGDNTLTLLDTAVTTIYVFEPTETAVYTFTAPEGAILGYWGAGSWFLSDPGSTTNTYEWTCTGVGQSAYIGVSGVDGEFNLNVEKTGEYTVVETPIVAYENKATLETFVRPEGSTLGSYVDVYGATHTAVLGDDGYYHLDSADGDILLIDMDYMDIILSAALKSDRPIMYAYMTDEDGNKFKYDIGNAVLAYEEVMDANGYYPVTEDIILFYQVYAVQAGTFTFHLTGSYNEECVWMYCMRTMKLAEVEEPTEPETEPTEPSTEATEPSTEATEPSTEATEPSTEATEPSIEPTEPVVGGTVLEVANESVTASGYVFEYTAETDGTLTVVPGTCTPGWRYKVYGPDGSESIYMTKWSASHDHEITAGTWKIVFYAYTSAAGDVAGTVSFTVNFTPNSGEEEIVKEEYQVSETELVLGDNTLTLLDTAVTTIYVFEPTETAVYTFTAPEGAILGYWGAGSWFLSNPNSTTNTYEWTCTGVGQTAYIGVSGVEGEFNLNIAKTGDYTVVETPIVKYENQATLESFTLPEGATLGGYVDVYGATHTAVLGEDGYYHLDSADGPILLIDMDYMDIILSAALKSDRPIMYAYMYDEDGNIAYKYDIGDAVLAYEAVMDANGYYPVTEDILLFYQVYAVQAGTYTFHLSGSYNEECVWMYCMRTMTLPEPEPTVELTHISLNPGKDALGYKAAATNLPEGAHVEISLWVNKNKVITKETTTLRLINILKYNGGETVIYAQATIVDADGNVIAESAVAQTTMRETLETVNDNWSTYSQAQQDAVKALCNQYYDTVANWGLDDILADVAPQVSVEQITVENQTMTVYGGASATFTLSGACTFAAQDTAETVAQNPYANWIADYYVSMDAQAQDGLYLAGNYGGYGWIAIPVAAGQTYSQVPLVSTMLDTTLTCTDVVTDVVTFSCGVADTLGNNAGATITVELRLTNPNDATQYVVLNSTMLSL